MTRVALFAGGDLSYYTTDFDYFVGIDRVTLFLVKNGLPLDIAVGDFDSVFPEELSNIKEKAKKLVLADVEKNDTDTELALKTVFKKWPDAQVTIFGAFGGRMDHFLSNIFLPNDCEIAPFMTAISLRDQQNCLSYRPAGRHQIEKELGMSYVAFMTDGDADLEIRGAKYELSASQFFKKKIYSSNEFDGKSITVSAHSGYIIIIQSKDRS